MSSNEPAQPDYLSYLLRLQRAHSHGQQVWRIALEEALTRQVQHGDTLADLLTFLCAQTGQDQDELLISAAPNK